MDFKNALEESHQALREFARSNPEPIKALYSHSDDATLANPFGATVRGWRQVSEALDFASSRFHDGDVDRYELLAKYESPNLVTVLEIEGWKSRVGEHDEITPFELRVTSTFRREDGAWKIVARHADPIRSFDPEGPLRAL